MHKKRFVVLLVLMIIMLTVSSPFPTIQAAAPGAVDDPPDIADEGFSYLQAPYLSEDGKTLFNAVPPRVLVVDPDPEMQGIKFPLEPQLLAEIADTRSTGATFDITYINDGTDPWGNNCLTFPSNAKTAFDAAAAIWANSIQSTVPITISACWSDNLPSGVLGGSGNQPLHKDFSGAPKANTWYQGSLANSLNGSDLDAGFDMHITYNSSFSWYYGTDGLTPIGQYDLVTVAAHEIAHGLNFSGSAWYSGGSGGYKIIGYPVIYDNFMEDLQGNRLSSYTNSSTALGNLFTSNSLWWNGVNANAANGGSRVKMYAPSTWSPGSSYSHLDYDTFRGTPNSMMVFAIGSGSSQHNPGEVTLGIFKDMGWAIGTTPIEPPLSPTNVTAKKGEFANHINVTWDASVGATYYQVFRDVEDPPENLQTLASNHTSTTYNDYSTSPNAMYYYWVKACNLAGCSGLSNSDWGWREQPDEFLVYLPLMRSGGTVTPPFYPLLNGDFEAGRDGSWEEYSSGGIELIIGGVDWAHSGSWIAYLGGYDHATEAVYQKVAFPASLPYLNFYVGIDSEDVCGFDYFYLAIGDDEIGYIPLCAENNSSGWIHIYTDLSAYAGRTEWLYFIVETDESLDSRFYLDTIFLSANPPSISDSGIMIEGVPVEFEFQQFPEMEGFKHKDINQ